MAITRVSGQNASIEVNQASPAVITLTNNPTTGNLVVVGATIYNGGSTITPYTVQDANGNTYSATTSTPSSDTGNFVDVGIWYLANAPSNASKTINISWTGGGNAIVDAGAGEYAGAATSNVLETDAVHVNNSTSSTNINDPTITTTNDGDLLFACCNGGVTFAINSANSPWTLVGILQTLGDAEDLIQTTHGSQAISFTQAGAHTWIAMAAAFKAPAAAGGSGSIVFKQIVTVSITGQVISTVTVT